MITEAMKASIIAATKAAFDTNYYPVKFAVAEAALEKIDALLTASEGQRVTGKDYWDSDSIEAKFHKIIRGVLTKKCQGYLMGEYRKAVKP